MQDLLLLTNTDSSEGFIKELFMNATYGRILNAYNHNDGAHLLEVHPFDIVLINAPLRMELGDRFAKYAALHTNTMVLFIARESTYQLHYEALSKLGVICVKKPVVVKPFQQLLKMLEISCQRLNQINKLPDSSPLIEELRLVDAAKWHLINQFSISESQAGRIVDQYAFANALSKTVSATHILEGAISTL